MRGAHLTRRRDKRRKTDRDRDRWDADPALEPATRESRQSGYSALMSDPPRDGT